MTVPLLRVRKRPSLDAPAQTGGSVRSTLTSIIRLSSALLVKVPSPGLSRTPGYEPTLMSEPEGQGAVAWHVT